MAANHALAMAGRDHLATTLGVAPIAPDAMTGSMAALSLPGSRDEAASRALQRDLTDLDGIQVPIMPWPVRAARRADDAPAVTLLRISAQRYNERADYERLAEALARRLAAEYAVGPAPDPL